MADLYVVAGPNGAGKSTFSDLLAPPGMDVFDADKLLALREKQFPDIDPAVLMDSITTIDFEEGKEKAIRIGKDYAYETNFANSTPLATAQEFKKAGYRVNLIFIGLGSVRLAAERVGFRIISGGHNVENAEIKSNYNVGLQNLRKHIGYFDRAVIVSSEKSEKLVLPKQLLRTEKGIVVERLPRLPKWAEKITLDLPVKLGEGQQVKFRR